MNEQLKEAINVLVRELADESYRMTWQANIAMSIYDACHWAGIPHHPDLHKACNDGAVAFLRILCIQHTPDAISENEP